MLTHSPTSPHQSYGTDNYTAYACYDFVNPSQPNATRLVQFGTYQSTSAASPSTISITPFNSSLSFPLSANTNPIQAGALLEFSAPAGSPSSISSTVTARFGVSFISSFQACLNAEAEVPTWDWDAVQEASREKWENVLERVILPNLQTEDATVVQLLYSSVRLVVF